jgi:hypothetical protein
LKAIFLQNCDFWERDFCPDPYLRKLNEKKFRKGKEFQLLKEYDLKKLNKTCSNCKNPLRIKEKKCPLCERTDIQLSESVSGGEMIATEIYNYKCDECDRFLYSHIKFVESEDN